MKEDHISDISNRNISNLYHDIIIIINNKWHVTHLNILDLNKVIETEPQI